MKKNKLDNDSLNDIIHLSKNILKLLYVVLIIGIVLCSVVICQQLGIFSFLGNLFQVLAPFFIGFIIAWLFSPLVLKLTKKGFSRIMASIIIYVVFLLFLIIFVRIFIPVLYDEVNELLSQLPTILNRLTDFVNNFFSSIKIDGFDIDNLKNNVVLSLNEYGYSIADSLPNFIMQTVSSLASGIGTIFFGLVIGLYMLFDFDNVSNILIKLFPRKYQMEGLNLLTDIGCEVRKTVNGTLLVASMVFVCDTIGFAVIGLNAALLLVCFAGLQI